MSRLTKEAIRAINGKDSNAAAAARDEWDRLVGEYRGYIDAHRAELPSALLELDLHDVPVRALEILGASAAVRVTVEAGSEARCIVYDEVCRIDANWDRRSPLFPGLRAAAIGAWLCDEISVLPSGGFRHEIIFDSGMEVSIDFGKVRVERASAPSMK